ncbi:MAG: hypothetical protein Q9225_004424 [Loekoesia sp. 1 TL-2023]
MNADAYLKQVDAPPTPSERPGDLQDAAASLLSAALEYLPSGLLPFSVRSKIDRTAVLAQNEPLLQFSVLNAPARRGRKQQSSLLPLLSRQFPKSYSTEALIRPRLPPLQQSTADFYNDADEEVDEKELTNDSNDSILPEGLEASRKGPSPTLAWSNGQQTSKAERTQTELSSIEKETSASFTQRMQQQEPEANVPAKRARESVPGELDATASDEAKHLLPPNGEPESKRRRNSGQGIYVPLATEDDLPRVAPPPSDNPAPTSAEVPAFSEPLANLRTINENLVDDDSDDSSIPPIDPTLDTDDEDYDDDDAN